MHKLFFLYRVPQKKAQETLLTKVYDTSLTQLTSKNPPGLGGQFTVHLSWRNKRRLMSSAEVPRAYLSCLDIGLKSRPINLIQPQAYRQHKPEDKRAHRVVL
jgi:hypothetical protein